MSERTGQSTVAGAGVAWSQSYAVWRSRPPTRSRPTPGTFPPDARARREFYLSVASERIYAHRAEGGLWMARRDGAGGRLVPVELDNDALYPLFVERTLADVRAGRPPVAGLAELEAVMRVVDAAYRSHRAGQVVTLDA